MGPREIADAPVLVRTAPVVANADEVSGDAENVTEGSLATDKKGQGADGARMPASIADG